MPGSQAGDKMRQPRFPKPEPCERVACSDDESESRKVSLCARLQLPMQPRESY